MVNKWNVRTAAASVALLAMAAAAQPVAIQKVVATGDPAPGTAGPFGQLYSPIVNADGRILFLAVTMEGKALYTWDGASIAVAAQQFQPAPGTSEGTFFWSGSSGSGPFLNYAYRAPDRFATAAIISGPDVQSSNDEGVWYFDGGEGHLVARDGTHAPGTPDGVTFLRLSSSSSYARMRMNSSGRMLFTGFLQGPGMGETNRTGMWTWSPADGLQKLLRGGELIPGTTDRFASYVMFEGRVNETGEVCFPARLLGGDGMPGVILHGPIDNLAPAALVGEAAPGIPDTVYSGFFDEPLLDDDGGVTFGARISGPGVTAANDIGLWRTDAAGAQLIARKGDPVPEVPGYEWFEFRPVTANSTGTIVFTARLYNPGVHSMGSIWIRRADGTLRLIIKDGDPALGTPPEYLYAGGGLIAINDSEQMVFAGGRLVPAFSGSAVLGWTPGLGVFIIAEGGTPLTFPDSSVRIVRDAFLTGAEPVSGPDLPSTSLTNGGQVTFQINFEDAPVLSGIFTGLFQEFAAAVSCRADLNHDGQVDFADYLEFLNLYDTGDPAADFNDDGLVDFADYLEFLNLYEAGC